MFREEFYEGVLTIGKLSYIGRFVREGGKELVDFYVVVPADSLASTSSESFDKIVRRVYRESEKGSRIRIGRGKGTFVELDGLLEDSSVEADGCMTLDDIQRMAIRDALDRNSWNREKTARELCISVKSIYNKIKRYGLKQGR